ncbi:MAG: agmatinase [Candidatus Omnitrophota bacterium]
MKRYGYFTGPDGFCSRIENANIVILPVPYDKTSTWIKGADKGPLALIKASSALELYDIETDFEVYKKGIYTCPPLSVDNLPKKMVTKVKVEVSKLLGMDKFVVTFGGEHSVSIGSISAHSKKYKNLSVLQLDAHADLREQYEGTRYNHACVAARIKEMCPVVQVGIRSMCVDEKYSLATGNVFLAEEIIKKDNWIKEINRKLSNDVYVTIDIDVFDPSVMPSTGTPEPGGLDWYQVTKLLKSVTEYKNVVGFDIVELCPISQNKAPDFLAAKLCYKFLSYVFKAREKR